MIVDNEQIKLTDWEPYKNMTHVSQEYNSDIPEDTPVTGFRILYQKDEGYYSPFTKNISIHPEKKQSVGEILHSSTPHGYYYFHTREVAENTLVSLIYNTHRKMLEESSFRPTGTLQVHRVEGVSAAPIHNRDEMKEMYVYKEPIAIIDLSELYPKTDVANSQPSKI